MTPDGFSTIANAPRDGTVIYAQWLRPGGGGYVKWSDHRKAWIGATAGHPSFGVEFRPKHWRHLQPWDDAP